MWVWTSTGPAGERRRQTIACTNPTEHHSCALESSKWGTVFVPGEALVMLTDLGYAFYLLQLCRTGTEII